MPTLSTEPPPKKAKKRRLPESEKHHSKKKAKNGSHNKQNGKNKNGTSNAPTTTTNSNNLRSVFARVAERRQKEITLLEPVLLKGFLMDIRELVGRELPSLVASKSPDSAAIKANRVAHDVRMLINAEYRKMSDEEKPPDERRKSWQIVNEIFRRIDALTGKDDANDDGDDESETRQHGIQTRKPMATPAPQATNGPLLSESGKESGTDPNAVAKQTDKATGNTQTSGSEKAAASGKANSQPSATPTSASTLASQQNSTTTTSASKNLNTSDTSTIDLTANNGAKTSSTSIQKKAPVRTVASLSSASAMTTATALGNNSSETIVNANGTVPNKQSIPAGKVPPPYQKHSAAAQQHKNEKLQKQHEQKKKDGVRPPTVTESVTSTSQVPNKSKHVVPYAAAALASEIASGLLASSSSTNTNGKAAMKASNPIPDVTNETEKPIDLKTKLKITLGPDDISKPTKYGGFMQHRSRVELEFNHHEPTRAMSETFQRRLEKWDPYWKVEKHFCIGVTSRVTRETMMYKPNMAGLFISKDLIKKAGPRLRQIYTQQPLHNEPRVLIRMLPLWISKQKNMGKDRADVHLWPKGTYLQILLPNGKTTPMPQEIQQRKQQSHDASKWLGICRHLDITSQVHKTYSSTSASLNQNSTESRFEVGSYEGTPYMFSLALCRYQSPQTLCQVLLDPHSSLLGRVGLDEMHQRVKKIMESNEVILDGDSDDDDNQANAVKEQKSIRFSIRDPIQRVVLQNPVRGRKCLHISCFDLASYLDINKTPSGQRWKCGHCETFLSYEDLELCALTEKASNQFGAQMDFLQNMVEIKEDGSMSLCKPVRSHQERARAKAAAAGNNASQTQTSQAGGGAQEVVELLDSDSD